MGDAVTLVLGTRFPEEEERGSGQLTAPNPFACRDPGPAQAGADTASAALRGEAGFPGTRARGRHGGSLSASYAPEPRARTPRLSTRAPPPRAPASGTGRRRGRERRRGNRGVASARRAMWPGLEFSPHLLLLIFWPHHAMRGILVPQQETEPKPPHPEQRLNHWAPEKCRFSSHTPFPRHRVPALTQGSLIPVPPLGNFAPS